MTAQLEKHPGDQNSLLPAWNLTKEQREQGVCYLSMSSEDPEEIPSMLPQKDTLYSMGRSTLQMSVSSRRPTQLVLRQW